MLAEIPPQMDLEGNKKIQQGVSLRIRRTFTL